MYEIFVIIFFFAFFPYVGRNPLILGLILILIIPGIYTMQKDVLFVPTPMKIVRRMIEKARLKRGEKIYDLGCGDGRIVFLAARQGAIAVGYERSLLTYLVAKIGSLFVTNSSIRFADFWKQDFRDADVIFCYLLTKSMDKFYRTIWPTLKPGTRVISHAFTMKELTPAYHGEGVVVYVK